MDTDMKITIAVFIGIAVGLVYILTLGFTNWDLMIGIGICFAMGTIEKIFGKDPY